jgi:hypothetical protein
LNLKWKTRAPEYASNELEVIMSETAVGLFDDAVVAEAVVDSLRAYGFPSSGIRVVAAPKSASAASLGSETGINTGFNNGNFATSAAKDLRAMGATEYESNAYLAGLHRGNVLVYATGSTSQANQAVAVMNEYSALEIEEFATAGAAVSSAPVEKTDLGTINPESRLPESNATIGAHEKSYTSHSSRSKTEGARVFAW